MATIPAPQFTDSVDLRYFIESLNAPSTPRNYLDRFPDALYNKAPDSHFLRFMYALLGPVGLGWLKQNLTAARLLLEASGASLFNLDAFYGDPFSFGRILTETFDDDISGVLPSEVWDRLRTQDEAYRSRAIQYMHAARLGGTPEGMRLAASSGVGQNVAIIENYRHLFDRHSDIPLDLPFYGSTQTTGEFVILPQPAISRSEQQEIEFAAVVLGVNPFIVTFNGRFTAPLAADSTATEVQSALEALQTIGPGNVRVSGGPPPAAMTVTFTGRLSNQDLPLLSAVIVADTPVAIPVLTTHGGVDPSSEAVTITDADRHHMQVAIDYLRPVASYPSFNDARSTLASQRWSTVTASSEFTTVQRFVTGSPAIRWPAVDNLHWIEASTERRAPQLSGANHQHYVGFHNIGNVTAYTDDALSDPAYATDTTALARYNSVHIGPFPEMRAIMPYFEQFTDLGLVFGSDRALADYAEPLFVSAQTNTGIAFINDVYPADYATLQNVPTLRYHDEHFWASRERVSGAEILEIDLGSPQAVNYVTLEVSRKPVTLTVDYDLLDQFPSRRFVPVTPIPGATASGSSYFDSSQQNPWQDYELYFNDGRDMIYTRFLRLVFTRRTTGSFLYDAATNTRAPWSIDVRNVRVGRNVAPSVV